MQRQVVQFYGILVTFLAIAGLFVGSGHLFGLMNADVAMDFLRLILAAVLLYVGFGSDNVRSFRGVLTFTGALYVGLAILGLLSPELWGLLPNGLTGFDIVFHLATGILALGAAAAHPAPHASARV